MIDVWRVADPITLMVALAVLALLVLGLASWRGRWPLWLAGYALAILALLSVALLPIAGLP